MTALPNPFESFNSAVGLETGAGSAAGPCFPDPTVPAGALFNSAALDSPSSPAEETAAATSAPEAAAVIISESAVSLPAQVDAPSAAGAVGPPPAPAGFNSVSSQLALGETAATVRVQARQMAGAADNSGTQYIPELFSVFAARRCKDIISPPLPKVERNIDSLALNAVGAALNIHPRDLDLDPSPLFLRKPRPAFLRALLELGSPR